MSKTPEQIAQELVNKQLESLQEAIRGVVSDIVAKGGNPDDFTINHNFTQSQLDPNVEFKIWVTPKLRMSRSNI